MTEHTRKLGPKLARHPSIGQPCQACNALFAEGDYTALVMLGPGNDPEAQEKARNGRAYNAVAVELHWACATGDVCICPRTAHDHNGTTVYEQHADGSCPEHGYLTADGSGR